MGLKAYIMKFFSTSSSSTQTKSTQETKKTGPVFDGQIEQQLPLADTVTISQTTKTAPVVKVANPVSTSSQTNRATSASNQGENPYLTQAKEFFEVLNGDDKDAVINILNTIDRKNIVGIYNFYNVYAQQKHEVADSEYNKGGRWLQRTETLFQAVANCPALANDPDTKRDIMYNLMNRLLERAKDTLGPDCNILKQIPSHKRTIDKDLKTGNMIYTDEIVKSIVYCILHPDKA